MIHVYRPIPVDCLRLLAFDLDGTLIDSAQDLCNSVNASLREFGMNRLPDHTIACFVCNGAPMLMRRSLALAAGGGAPEDVDPELFDKAYAFFLQYYKEHKLDFTRAYSGVLDALNALQRLREQPCGVTRQMAVLTNKPVRPARGICEGLGLAGHFFRIYGGDSFPVKKPDPLGLRSLMEEAGASPEETVMVGDSVVDVRTARNAGAWVLGCNFGFGPQNIDQERPDILVDSAAEWTEALAPAPV